MLRSDCLASTTRKHRRDEAQDLGNNSPRRLFHGYGIWTTLKERFHSYLDLQNRRNVYHHLYDLKRLGLVERNLSQTNKNAPKNHPYKLTDKGRTLEERFRRYLDIL